MQTIDLFVENIKCGGCMNSIRTALLKIEGVSAVNIDKEEDRVSVEVSDSGLKSAIISALSSMGYPEIGHNDLLKKAKSYVSCAIGRMTAEEA